MLYGSVCSGIEAASTAWHALGWQPSFFSEIEAFPRAVLNHRYPSTPCHGDFTTISASDYDPIELLVGGTPCQSFSVAGLRKGFADARGNLTLEFLRLAERLDPRWLVWEIGVLSQDGGRAFAAFLGGLAELGYGFAYRVLDAQYFGVPQRRRRVFVVGYLGDWRPPAAVLFERESLLRDLTPRRETRKDVAPGLSARTKDGGGLGTDFECDGGLIASTGDIAHCLNAGGMGRQDYETETLVTHSLRGEGFDASEDGTGRGIPLVPMAYRTNSAGQGDGQGDCAAALTTMTDPSSQFVAFAQNTRDEVRLIGGDGQIAGALAAETGMKQQTYVAMNLRGRESVAMPEMDDVATSSVRRLTPVECERLQGFPDNFTNVPYRGKAAADGPRYKALGNSMAVPVMRWLGERVDMVERLRKHANDNGQSITGAAS